MFFPDAQLPALVERALVPALHFLFGLGAALAAGGSLLMLVPGFQAPRSMDPRWGRIAGPCARWVQALLLGWAFTAGAGAWLGELVLRPRAAARLAEAFGPALGAGGLFVVAGTVGLAIYAAGWRRGRGGSPAHLAAGVLAAAGIWAGGAVLVCVQSFSLNPGRWLTTRALGDALLHPSGVPALALWASGAILLAAAAGLAAASGQRDAPWRLSLVRTLAAWAAPAAWAGAAAGTWWALSLPPAAREGSFPGLAGAAVLVLAGLGACLYRCGVREPRRLKPAGALAVLLAALLASALVQLARGEARGPFLIRGYMYRNQILAEEIPELQRGGFWQPAAWRPEADVPSPEELGGLVFRAECAACHPGWKKGAAPDALPPFREEGAALRFLGGMERGHPAFPAFAGAEGEMRAVAVHLEDLLRSAGVTLAPPAPPAPKVPPKAPAKKEARPAPKEAPKEPPQEKAPGAPPAPAPKPEAAAPAPPPAPPGEAAPAGEAPPPKPEPKAEEAPPAAPKPPETSRPPEAPTPAPPSQAPPSSQAAPPSPAAGSAPPAGEAKPEAPLAPAAPPAGSGSGNPGAPAP